LDSGTGWKLKLFAENATKVKEGFKHDNEIAKRLAALIYALDGKPIDISAITSGCEIMKGGTHALSVFREDISISISATMSIKGNQKTLFDRTAAVFEMMKDAGFWSSWFLAAAAYLVAVNSEPNDHKQTVARMRSFFEGFKARHRFSAGNGTIIFATVLALSEADMIKSVENVERLYLQLEKEFSEKSIAITMAQMMVAGGMLDKASTERILALRDAFKAKGMRLDPAFTLVPLGFLAQLPADVNILVEDIKEALMFLKSQKEVGPFEQELLLYSMAITASGYTERSDDILMTATVFLSAIFTMIASTSSGGRFRMS